MLSKYLNVFEIDYITNKKYKFKSYQKYKNGFLNFLKKNKINDIELEKKGLKLLKNMLKIIEIERKNDWSLKKKTNKKKEIKYRVSDFVEDYYFKYNTNKLLFSIGYLNSFNDIFYLNYILDIDKIIKVTLKKINNEKYKIFQFYGHQKRDNFIKLNFELNGGISIRKFNQKDKIFCFNKNSKISKKIIYRIDKEKKELLDVKLFLESIFQSWIKGLGPINKKIGKKNVFLPTSGRLYIFNKR